MRVRSSSGYGVVEWATVLMRFPARSTIATSIPSSEVPLMIPATRISVQLPLQFFQHPKRFNRTHLIEIQRPDSSPDLVRTRFKQPNLNRRVFILWRELFHRAMFRGFVQTQNRPCALNNGCGQARKPRHLDAVAAVGFAGLHLPQKNDAIAR